MSLIPFASLPISQEIYRHNLVGSLIYWDCSTIPGVFEERLPKNCVEPAGQEDRWDI